MQKKFLLNEYIYLTKTQFLFKKRRVAFHQD